MIVLDENMLGLRLDQVIARWYPGRVCSITDLRPGTIIKDETIALLLQQARGATFVTTNVTDFWRRVPAHARYCIVCLALPNEQLRQLPDLLRRFLRMPEWKTKAGRMGKVARVSRRQLQYYAVGDDRLHSRVWSG